MNNIVLSKESTNNEVREYFKSIFNLTKSANKFPVNLDEVCPLVYGRKQEAVRALVSDPQFIEGFDYQVLRRNAENLQGGRPTEDYVLTVPCLEFFIARKVRPVFEVYRQVFHKVANEEAVKPATIRDKMAVATWLIKTLNLNDNSKLKLAKTIADPLGLPTPDYTESKDQLLSTTLGHRTVETVRLHPFRASVQCQDAGKGIPYHPATAIAPWHEEIQVAYGKRIGVWRKPSQPQQPEGDTTPVLRGQVR